MDDVVVTATQTENSVLKTASNIAVITADEIKKSDAENVAEVLKKLPGIFYTNASGLEPKISLRATHIGMSPGALVLLNGIPVNVGKFGYTDYESIPIENIERIEVVKGPMSSLYGGNSARGVINIITKRAKKDFGGEISMIAGSSHDQRYSALVYGNTGEWDYNLNVKKRSEDGYRDETWLDNYYVNGEVGYWLSDDFRIGTYASFTDKERSLAKKLKKSQRDADPTQAVDYSLTDNQDVIIGVNADLKKEMYDFKTILYYKYRDKTYENYLMATSTPYLEDLEEDVFGVRSIFTWKQPMFGRANKLSLGFDYDDDQIDLKTDKATSKTIGAPYEKNDPKKTGDFSSRIWGVFLQDELAVSDRLTLTAGLRYDYLEFENNALYDFTQDGKYTYDNNPDYSKLNPKISLNYQVAEQTAVYGSFSKSYRPPSIYDYYASGSYASKNNYVLEPETFTQYEAGVRHTFSKAIALDTSVYFLTVDDMLDSAYEDGKYMGKQNIGKVEIMGLELALSGSPCRFFSYTLGYSYTEAEYAEDIFTKGGDNINGNRTTKIPKHRFVADAQTLVGEWEAHKLYWNLGFIAQDEFAMDNVNSQFYPGYMLMDTKIRLLHDTYSIFFSIDNLLDRDYDGYAYVSSGKDYYYPAAGRTFAFGVEYRF